MTAESSPNNVSAMQISVRRLHVGAVCAFALLAAVVQIQLQIPGLWIVDSGDPEGRH